MKSVGYRRSVHSNDLLSPARLRRVRLRRTSGDSAPARRALELAGGHGPAAFAREHHRDLDIHARDAPVRRLSRREGVYEAAMGAPISRAQFSVSRPSSGGRNFFVSVLRFGGP